MAHLLNSDNTTGYNGLTVITKDGRVMLSTSFCHGGFKYHKQITIGIKARRGKYTYEHVFNLMFENMCKVLSRTMPKNVDLTRGLKKANKLGYSKPHYHDDEKLTSIEFVKTPILINLNKVVNKSDLPTNTGYENIRFKLSGKYLYLKIQIKKNKVKVCDKSISLNKTTYESALHTMLELREEHIVDSMPETVDYTIGNINLDILKAEIA